MQPTTTQRPAETTDAEPKDPEQVRRRLERRARDAARRHERHLCDAVDHLRAAAARVEQLRDAAAAHRLLAVEAQLLAAVHDDVEADVPGVDRSAPETVERHLRGVEEALGGETGDELTARSARTVLDHLRGAVRDGDPEEARRRARQLLDRLDHPAGIEEEDLRRAFVSPAAKRWRERREREVVQRAHQVGRELVRGNMDAQLLRDPNGAPTTLPEDITELLEELAADPGGFRVELPERRDEVTTAEDLRGRDLEAEVRSVVTNLPDGALEGS